MPREENHFADALSKFRDTDDWSIDGKTFLYIQRRFRKLSVDRFADEKKNAKLSRFDARFRCPEAETVNTFMADGANDFNWWSPPYPS